MVLIAIILELCLPSELKHMVVILLGPHNCGSLVKSSWDRSLTMATSEENRKDLIEEVNAGLLWLHMLLPFIVVWLNDNQKQEHLNPCYE
jgi:hypothetical protein